MSRLAGDAAAAAATLGMPAQLVRVALEQHGVIQALDETAILDDAVLCGGSAVAGCYGGPRVTRTLTLARVGEPAGDSGVSGRELEELSEAVAGIFGDVWGVEATATALSDGRIEVGVASLAEGPMAPPDRVYVDVMVRPGELPSQTSEIRPWRPVVAPRGMRAPIVAVESADEIVADMVLSFATATSVRWHDLADVAHLSLTQATSDDWVCAMVGAKAADAGVADVAAALGAAAARARDQWGSGVSLVRGMLPAAQSSPTTYPHGVEGALDGALSLMEDAVRPLAHGGVAADAEALATGLGRVRQARVGGDAHERLR